MKKSLLTIRLRARSENSVESEIIAIVKKIGTDLNVENFKCIITDNNNVIFNETYKCSRFFLVKLKVIDEMRNRIDLFDSEKTTINILEDSHKLLKFEEFRCPKCHRKLFESWGKIKGIKLKCNRCGSFVTSG